LAGDLLHHNEDSHAVVDAAWRQLVGLMLSAPPVLLARELLDELPPAPDPVLNWWLTGVRLAVDAGVIPLPPTAADAAIRRGQAAPPGLRGLILASGWQLVSDVVGTPMACGQHLVRIIKSGAVRRAIQTVADRLTTAAWRGDDDQLAEMVRREAGALVLLAERVTG